MRLLLRVAVLTALALGSTLAPLTHAQADTSAYTSGEGLTVLSATQVDARVVKLVVATPALARPVRISVLLPDGYDAGDRRYPVLYLLHGTSGGADDWLDHGSAEASTAGLPLIVVMPDGGYDDDGGSWWTDWVDQHTALGTADWETFDIDQLIPWVDAHLRTVAARGGRAIAGLSQGGFGAYTYASRHPDLFASAGSFSGAPDIARNPLAKVIGPFIVGGIMAMDGVEPFAPFGDPVTDQVTWQGHNPASLVTNLRGMDLELWTGDGPPGSSDTIDPALLSAVPIEVIVHASTHFFAQAATAAGVRYRLTDYGAGTHTWPYWTRDLQQYLPRLMTVLAHPAPAPTRIGYRSIDREYAAWGWDVAVHRSRRAAFTGLAAAGATGFTYAGADPATVTTPPAYEPGRSYRVSVRGVVTPQVADAAGRLTVDVPRPGWTHTLRVGITG